MRWYHGYVSSRSAKKSGKSSQNDEDSAPVWGILAMTAAAALMGWNNQAELPLVGNKKEELITFLEGVIADMAAAAALENLKQIPQKDYDSAPVGSISTMTAAAVLRKHNNQAESPAGFNV